jgi:O-antigen/teichoic acid export membrane protein
MNKALLIQFAKKNAGLFANFTNLGFIQVSNILIQLILFPIIIRTVGLESFGSVAVANAMAGFIGLFINYGTNLSGIKDVALQKNNPSQLSALFFGIYYTRIALFIPVILILIGLYLFQYNQFLYIFFATPIILAEVVNPLFFFNGIEKLTLYNTANLLAKLGSALLIIFFMDENAPAWLVNFYLGITNFFFYGCLAFYAIKKYKLSIPLYRISSIIPIVKGNFYLVCNNLSVHLQQSFFLFLLPVISTPIIVGAYSLADKVISTFRILLVAFSSALYPKTAVLYKEKKESWPLFKKRINRLLFFTFLLITIFIFWGNEWIVFLFTGSKNILAANYIRSIAWVPLLAAMNSLNIIELLIKNQYRAIFHSSISLLVFILIVALVFAFINRSDFFGYYLVIAEAAAIPISLFFIRKNSTPS